MNCKRKIILVQFLIIIINSTRKINARKVQVCDLMIAIDEPLFNLYEKNSSKLIDFVQLHVKELNDLYQRHFKDFSEWDIIYFKIKTIRFLFNFCHDCNTNITKTLEEFTKIPSSDYCLAHLFTYRDFTENVGFAYTGGPKLHGGICAKSHNTGLTSLLNRGVNSANNLNIFLHDEKILLLHVFV